MPSNTATQPAAATKRPIFELSDVEVETLGRAAHERGLPFDGKRRSYSHDELKRYGLVREAYTRKELEAAGFRYEEVSSFDEAAKKAENLLRVDAPFGDGIRKWQLPIPDKSLQIHMTYFPPNTKVTSHVHPVNSAEEPGGGFRLIVKGTLQYKGRTYGAGDWFFIPNGKPYEFHTAADDGGTIVIYRYAFFGHDRENRFSHPMAEGKAARASATAKVARR